MEKIFGGTEKKSLSNAWKGAILGLFVSMLLQLSLFAYGNFPGNIWIWHLPFFVGVTIAIMLLITLLFPALVRIAARIPWAYCGLLAAQGFLLYIQNLSETWMGLAALSCLIVVLPSALGGLLLYAPENKGRLFKFLALPLCLAAAVVAAFWFFSPGTIIPLNAAKSSPNPTPLQLPDPSQPGSYTFTKIHYGSGNDRLRKQFGSEAAIKTPPVDGSSFISGWNGFIGDLRTQYWGFGPENLPLNGTVWMPEGKGPFPLVLIVHGNHMMEEFSDSGYGYLGEHFASHGFILVSIDENFFNDYRYDDWSTLDTTAARGWMLLEHLKQWRGWTQEEGHPFFGKADMGQIALMGHSRGGEAIVTAAAFNTLPLYPDNALVAFDYGFSIKALAAIAPVDGQYKPAGLETPLHNVDYFVIHGSHDADVRSFRGLVPYQRLSFDQKNYMFKAGAYVIGANHGQFNTVWGAIDLEYPEAYLLNTKQLIPAETQRKIAKTYLTAFLFASIKNDERYLPLFWDSSRGSPWLGRVPVINLFEDSNCHYLLANKQDLNITQGTYPGCRIEAENLSEWKLERVSLRVGIELQNAMYAGWVNPATLSLTVPEGFPQPGLKGSLVLNAADSQEFAEDSDQTDFNIELRDAAGEMAKLPLSQFNVLYPPIEAEIFKSTLFDTFEKSEPIFQTFVMPLEAFVEQNPRLNPEKIEKISFIFDRIPYGLVIFDRIGFRNR